MANLYKLESQIINNKINNLDQRLKKVKSLYVLPKRWIIEEVLILFIFLADKKIEDLCLVAIGFEAILK